MTEEEMSEGMRQLLREMDAPPAPPREEMWARIQAERARRNAGGADAAESRDVAPETSRRDVIDLRPRRRVAVWVQLGAALAAMLLLGIGIGRFGRVPSPLAAPAAVATADTPVNAQATSSSPYRLVATEHMRRTETLLTSLRVDDAAAGTTDMQAWASELLTNTRLLLDSPAARDVETRNLLEDLELVLSQIALMPASQASSEVKLIQDGLNQSDVLLRLRAATSGPRLVGT